MKRTWCFLVASLAFAFSVGVLVQVVAAADADIVISEVVYNARCQSSSSDVCGSAGSEARFEWVEIYNRGNDPVSLTGWQTCDLRSTPTCRTIPATTIGSRETWVIGFNAAAMQAELQATGHSGTWNPARFIALDNPIGDGLTNDITSGVAEGVRLLNASSTPIDCVSWASTAGTSCGAEGQNTTLNNALQAVSIANIQGTWFFHGPDNSPATDQSSPFDANNIARGGSPTAVTLNTFTANTAPFPIAAALAVLGFIAMTSGLIAARRRRQPADL